jgi:hypothetical protein
MTNPFMAFAFTCSPDVFNEPIGNEYLGVGRHEVTIKEASIENGQYGLQMALRYSDAAGKTFNHKFNLIAKPKEGEEGLVKPHFMYNMFGQALFLDPIVRVKVLMQTVPSNTALVQGLVGTRLGVEIEAPTKGYTIKDVGNRKALFDIETNSFVTDDSFETFDEAKKRAEELGLKRGYSNVKKLFAIDDDTRKSNDLVGSAIVNSGSTPITRRPAAAKV